MNEIMSIKGTLGVYEAPVTKSSQQLNGQTYQIEQSATFPESMFPDEPGNVMQSIEVRDDSGLVAFRRIPIEGSVYLHSTRKIVINWNFTLESLFINPMDNTVDG